MRVSIFVDGANIFYMQKDTLRWWIDLHKLLKWIESKTQGEIVDAFYYVGEEQPPDDRQQAFLSALTRIGYSVITKELKNIVQSDGRVVRKANLDIEIVLDMFNTVDNYDMAVLMSGDGDFERPLKLLRARGKRVLVLSTEGFIARELREVAGMHFVDFENIREEVQKDQIEYGHET